MCFHIKRLDVGAYRIVIFGDPVERVANDAFKQWELQPSAEWTDKRKGNGMTRMSGSSKHLISISLNGCHTEYDL